jgi:hypothetical protein
MTKDTGVVKNPSAIFGVFYLQFDMTDPQPNSHVSFIWYGVKV